MGRANGCVGGGGGRAPRRSGCLAQLAQRKEYAGSVFTNSLYRAMTSRVRPSTKIKKNDETNGNRIFVITFMAGPFSV